MAIQIGFIGAGSRAARHCAILRDLPDAHIRAIADVAIERAQSLAARFGAQPYSSAGRMLNAQTLDAVWICVPPDAHGAPEKAVCKAGVALFVDGPIADSMRTANAIHNAIQRAGTLAGVAAPYLYAPAFEAARRTLKGKNAPLTMSGIWSAPDATDWLDAWPLFDAIRILAGEPASLTALAGHNALALAAQTKGGALVNLSVAASSERVAQLHIVGAKGVGRLGELNAETLDWRFSADGQSNRIASSELLRAQDSAFLEALRGGKRTLIRSPYSEALKTLKWVLAASKAANRAGVVEI